MFYLEKGLLVLAEGKNRKYPEMATGERKIGTPSATGGGGISKKRRENSRLPEIPKIKKQGQGPYRRSG